MIHVDKTRGIPAYQQIYDGIRNEITSGTLTAGTKLPALRTLAKDLGVARNTVEAAYGQLVLEGYLRSRRGSGYIVEELDFSGLDSENQQLVQSRRQHDIAQSGSRAALAHMGTEYDAASPCTYNFSYGNRGLGTFPVEQWKSCIEEALRTCPEGLTSYIEDFGLWELRETLVRRLKETRGVRCSAEQVALFPGTQSALNAIITLFDHDARTVCMEEPGYYAARSVFESRSCKLVGVPVYKGAAEFASRLDATHANMLWLTPSNQFPTGTIMPLKSRLRAIEWAMRENAFIIEDDYCCEFRYGAKPVPSLHSLDTLGHVIYLGTLSKIISPALRISYAVFPEQIIERWRQISPFATSSVPWLDQKALHLFMTRGKWNSHVRRTVNLYKSKRDLLVSCLKKECGNHIDILGSDAGQHLLVGVKDGRSSSELIELAKGNDVRLYSLDHCWISEKHPMDNYMLLGFSSISDELIPAGVAHLRQAWFD